ncbi:MAG: DUF624 domain-containing protein [Chloroflexi bacterium]|nr:DUF624 domain-containing protein [Chloroflexota bacterium]
MGLSNLRETAFWIKLERAADFVLISILWVVLSLPLITLPAVTAGLFAVHTDWVQGKESEALLRFFSAIRQYAWRATLMGFGSILGLGLVAANLTILPDIGLPFVLFAFSAGISVFVGGLILMANLYGWVLLPIFDLPLSNLVKTALQLTFQHVVWSIAVLLATGIVVLASLWLLPAGGIVLVLPSGLAWIISRGSWHVLRSYEGQILKTQ